MKGYRFYLEYPNKKEKRHGTRKKPGNHIGTVIAAYGNWYLHHCNSELEHHVDCIGAVFNEANSPVCGTSAALGYIDSRCKRISEKLARQIHPRLFVYLEEDHA